MEARETYVRFLEASAGDASLVHERKRAQWAIARIDLVAGDASPTLAQPAPPPAPEPQSKAQPSGVEVIVAPRPPAPASGGAASCRCETAPSRERGGLWLALLGSAAWLRRRWPLWLILFAACTPPPEPVIADAPPPPAPAHEPIVEAPPPDGLTVPVVVRCKTGRACDTLARVRRRDGAIEHVPTAWIPRDSPVLVDDENVYWAGFAVRKSDLSRVELDWRDPRLRAFTQDDENLVVTDDQGLYLLPKDGSPRREIVADKNIWCAAADPSHLVWTVDHGSRVGDVVIANRSGHITHTAKGEQAPCVTQMFDGDPYWFNFGNGDGAIRTRVRDREITLAQNQDAPRDLVATPTHVYWITDEDAGRIARRVPLDGGTPEKLGSSHELVGHRSNRDRIAVHEGYVYWNAAHSVVRAPIEGGETKVVVTADIPGDVISFAIDGDHIYVAAHISQGR